MHSLAYFLCYANGIYVSEVLNLTIIHPFEYSPKLIRDLIEKAEKKKKHINLNVIPRIARFKILEEVISVLHRHHNYTLFHEPMIHV